MTNFHIVRSIYYFYVDDLRKSVVIASYEVTSTEGKCWCTANRWRYMKFNVVAFYSMRMTTFQFSLERTQKNKNKSKCHHIIRTAKKVVKFKFLRYPLLWCCNCPRDVVELYWCYWLVPSTRSIHSILVQEIPTLSFKKSSKLRFF